MNLLSFDALRELGALIEDEKRDGADQRLLTFRSARPKLFAAGADMAQMRAFSGPEAEEFARAGQELFAAIERLPMLTVALIDGDCFGGALDLALAFDLRFATPRSRFAHPGARIGIVTGFGGTSRWRKILSLPAAHALFLSSEVIGAAEALRMNLVERVGEDHEQELTRLESTDAATVSFVKELTIHAPRLSRSQLLLMANRLGHLYFGGSPWNR